MTVRRIFSHRPNTALCRKNRISAASPFSRPFAPAEQPGILLFAAPLSSPVSRTFCIICCFYGCCQYRQCIPTVFILCFFCAKPRRMASLLPPPATVWLSPSDMRLVPGPSRNGDPEELRQREAEEGGGCEPEVSLRDADPVRKDRDWQDRQVMAVDGGIARGCASQAAAAAFSRSAEFYVSSKK